MKCALKKVSLPVDDEDEIKLIETEYGLKGWAVMYKLKQFIGAHGYYIKWDIDTQLLFMRDKCLTAVGQSCVSEIVACAVRRGVFDSSMFQQHGILTCKESQETFLTANKRSRKVIIEKTYALPVVYDFIQDVNKSGKSVNIFFKNADISATKERKEKERKEKERGGSSNIYGLHNLVTLSDSEYDSLRNEIGEKALKEYINRVDGWLASGHTLKASHANTILKWFTQDKSPPSTGEVTTERLNELFGDVTEDNI